MKEFWSGDIAETLDDLCDDLEQNGEEGEEFDTLAAVATALNDIVEEL